MQDFVQPNLPKNIHGINSTFSFTTNHHYRGMRVHYKPDKSNVKENQDVANAAEEYKDNGKDIDKKSGINDSVGGKQR